MQTFRLENFVAAPSDLKKREVTTLEVRYNPRNSKQVQRIRTMRDRAVELGVDYKISRNGDALKISLSGYKGAVKRVLNPTYRSSTRRRSSQKRSSSRRRSQRGGGLFDAVSKMFGIKTPEEKAAEAQAAEAQAAEAQATANAAAGAATLTAPAAVGGARRKSRKSRKSRSRHPRKTHRR
jgi:hypothetical protein